MVAHDNTVMNATITNATPSGDLVEVAALHKEV